MSLYETDDTMSPKNSARYFLKPRGKGRKASNPRSYPCPTCGRADMLTPEQKAKGYQCNYCADRDEGLGY